MGKQFNQSMFRPLRHAIGLAAALLAAMGLYFWGIAAEERYSIFDLLKGRPAPAVIGQAGGLQPLDNGGGRPAFDLEGTELLEQVNTALADLTEAVVPSVVSIDTTTTIDVPRYTSIDPFGFFGLRRSVQRYQSPGLGSGVIVSEDGYVLTNHHVVADVDDIQITTHDGETYDAKWEGSDPSVDVAVLKIVVDESKGQPRVFQPLSFGDSDQVRVGEQALAVGNPFGLNETVTRGIISAKQRRLSDGANEYFQTDAVINPGNSGGPLIDVRGQIIGLNTAIFTGQQDVRVWQGIGLAIPGNEAREVFEAVVFDQPLLRGYLGLELNNLNQYEAAILGLRSARGVIVLGVADDSPAREAGIVPGDVIVKFDNAEVRSAESTLRLIRQKEAGEKVALDIFREGQVTKVGATIAEAPDRRALRLQRNAAASGQGMTAALGLTVRDLNETERRAFGLDQDDPAVLIADVKRDSQASRRFLPGDLIHVVNREPVETAAEFFELMGSLPESRDTVMILTRRGHRFEAILTPGR